LVGILGGFRAELGSAGKDVDHEAYDLAAYISPEKPEKFAVPFDEALFDGHGELVNSFKSFLISASLLTFTILRESSLRDSLRSSIKRAFSFARSKALWGMVRVMVGAGMDEGHFISPTEYGAGLRTPCPSVCAIAKGGARRMKERMKRRMFST
jgi:hypothetical protein